MGEVGIPHEIAGLRKDEVTITELLSAAGYATAHFGKGHLGDIEESYPHNQDFQCCICDLYCSDDFFDLLKLCVYKLNPRQLYQAVEGEIQGLCLHA